MKNNLHPSSTSLRWLAAAAGCALTMLLHAEEKPVSILDAPIGGHIHPSICRTAPGTLIVVYRGTNVLMCARSADGGAAYRIRD